MAECRPIPGEYTWQNCEDFQLPQNSVWYGRDNDGSDIFCGKAWCDGEEVPAKVIPNRRECKVIDNGCERVVPNCRKVLICRRDEGDNCHRRRDHCHRRRSRHCHDNSSSSESDQEESTTTEKSTCCNNESKVLEKNVKSCSSSTTTIVKKGSKNHHKKGGNECWYETRTRMVPKVTVQPRVRYFPKVINERTVRYVQERYTVKVCGGRCCDSCESRESSETCRPFEPCNPCKPCEPCNPCEPCEPCNPCEPCEPCRPCQPCEPCRPCEPCDPCDPCSSNRKNKTVVISEHSEEKKQSHRCRSKSPSRKIKWF